MAYDQFGNEVDEQWSDETRNFTAPGHEWDDLNFNDQYDSGITDVEVGDGLTTTGGPDIDYGDPVAVKKFMGTLPKGVGDVLKAFVGGDWGKALTSGATLASLLYPLTKDAYKGPVDARGNRLNLQSIGKFAPSGSYNPANLGYADNYGRYDPYSFNTGELGLARDFFEDQHTPDEIYDALNKSKLTGAQGVDAWVKTMGDPSQRDQATNVVNDYLSRTGKTLSGGFKPEDNPLSAARPELKTKYAQGGGIPRSDQVKGGLLPISAMLLEKLTAAGGQDDVVPINAAPGEYVLDAEIVSALGDGNTEAGVRKLDQMRKNIRSHKRGGALSQIAPKARPIDRYLEKK